jgi:hypothetical protein
MFDKSKEWKTQKNNKTTNSEKSTKKMRDTEVILNSIGFVDKQKTRILKTEERGSGEQDADWMRNILGVSVTNEKKVKILSYM